MIFHDLLIQLLFAKMQMSYFVSVATSLLSGRILLPVNQTRLDIWFLLRISRTYLVEDCLQQIV